MDPVAQSGNPAGCDDESTTAPAGFPSAGSGGPFTATPPHSPRSSPVPRFRRFSTPTRWRWYRPKLKAGGEALLPRSSSGENLDGDDDDEEVASEEARLAEHLATVPAPRDASASGRRLARLARSLGGPRRAPIP